MATNSFVYWSDGLGGRAFDHHSRNGGHGICQQKMPATPGISPFFQMLGVCPGPGDAGIDLHITKQVSFVCKCQGGGTLLNFKSPAPRTNRASNARGLPGDARGWN